MTAPRDRRTFIDDDTTSEEENLHGQTGIIERDARGQARWVVHAPTNAERTFDVLKALDTDQLAIEGSEAPKDEPKPSPKSGYNPYDTGPAKPPTKRR